MSEEELFHLAFDQSTIGMAILSADPSQKILMANAAFCRLTGYTQWQLLSPDHQKNLLKSLKHSRQRSEALLMGRSVLIHSQRSFLSQSGQKVEASLSSSIVRNHLNKPLYFVLQLERVKDRRGREQSDEGARFAIDQPGLAGFWINPEGRLLYVSEEACRSLGYSRVELLNMTIHDIDPLSSIETCVEDWNEIEQSQRFTFESYHKRKDGTSFPVHVSVNRFKIGGNEHYFATARDITEKKRVEEELGESEEKFRGLVETSQDLIWRLDHEGRFTYLNPAWENTLGYPVKEMIGHPFTDFKRPEEATRTLQEYKKILQGGSVRNYESTYLSKSGEERVLRFKAKPFFDTKGKILGTQGTANDITQQKQIEEALQESNRIRSTLLSNLPGMAYRCLNNRERTLEYISDGCLELTGYRPEDLIGNKGVSYGKRIIHSEDRKRVWDEVQASLNEKNPFQLIYRIISLDNELRWVWEKGRGIYAENGNLIALEGFVTDITNQKQIDFELKVRNRQQEVVAVLGQQALKATDLDFLMDQAVQLVTETLDVDYSKILELLPDGKSLRLRAGRGWKEGSVGHTTIPTGSESQAGYTLLSTKPVIVDNLRKESRFNGPKFLFDHGVISGMSVIIPGTHWPFGVLGAHTKKHRVFSVDDAFFLQSMANVLGEGIERRQTEEKLRRKSAILHELHAINTIPRLGKSQLCDEVVAAMAVFFEVPYAMVEVCNDYESEFLSIWNHGTKKGGFRMAIKGTPSESVKQDREPRQFQGLLRDQFPTFPFSSQHPIQAYVGCPILNSQGQAIGIVSLMHDSSRYFSDEDIQTMQLFGQIVGAFLERIHLEEELQHAEKLEAIGQLAGGVAHEFNNILTAIIGNLDLALRQTVKGSEIWSNLTRSDYAARRAADLTQQLLAFSRRSPVYLQPQDLRNISNEIAGLLRQTVDRRIDLLVNDSKGVWPILADLNQMNQVIMNLCVNARDALMDRLSMKEQADWKPTIRLRTENVRISEEYCKAHYNARPGDFVRLSISDNGIGIDQTIQDRIFEPFFTTKEVGRGTGLGLATVYGIIKQHEGWIELHVTKGYGTTFDVYIPRTDQSIQDCRETELNPVGIGNETVLFVDDEPSIRRLAQSVLERYGYSVLLAQDGQEVIDLVSQRASKIDLIVLDLTLPHHSGWEILHEIRKRDQKVKIIISSGHRMNSKVKDLEGSSSVSFLPKPYRPDQLAQKIRSSLDQ